MFNMKVSFMSSLKSISLRWNITMLLESPAPQSQNFLTYLTHNKNQGHTINNLRYIQTHTRAYRPRVSLGNAHMRPFVFSDLNNCLRHASIWLCLRVLYSFYIHISEIFKFEICTIILNYSKSSFIITVGVSS